MISKLAKAVVVLCGLVAVTSAEALEVSLQSRPAVVDELLTSTAHSASDKWGIFKEKFGKNYATFEQETAAFEAFAENERIIKEHNAKGLSFTLGHNEFSDLSWDEFKALYISGMKSNPHLRRAKNYESLPKATAASVDWVSKGAVTPIKNQGQCGSCWAFSTTGSFEGAYQIATGNLVSFSEQQLVSCDKVDDGCSGGLMDNAFGWIKSNGGLCTEDDYPYTSSAGSTGSCKSSCSAAATLTGFKDVTQGDEDALKNAVAKGPVSVAIEADKSVFQLYKSGVFTSASECGTQLDHGVLVVGYGTDSGDDYWKVKNSWGESWGEEGYIRMIRDKDCCGIASQPSYPTGVSGDAPGPSPSPTPGPSPSPTPSGKTHYGDPANGCESDEQAVQVQGISGDFCSPPCSNGSCPTDVPSGVTATGECILQDTSGDQYCALECNPLAYSGECGSASCQEVQFGVGICTYSD